MILIGQIYYLQFYNTIIQIALVIFKYLLSINRIAQLQQIIQIDCNSNTKTLSNIPYFIEYNVHTSIVRTRMSQ
jgi:hypothetical protein